jgi:hypothetical protein
MPAVSVMREEKKMAAKLTLKIIKILNHFETILVSPVLLYRFLRYGYTFRRIYLGEGKYTILDSADYYWLRDYSWYLTGKNGKFYVARVEEVANTRIKIKSMQRDIINARKGELVDHRNNNPMDNRSANLRLATREQNVWHRSKMRSYSTSKYIGVCRVKARNRWLATLLFRGKQIWIGRFENEIDAAKAYDKAAKKYFGEFAPTPNFPDPPDKFPGLEYYLAKLWPILRSWFALTIKKLSSS